MQLEWNEGRGLGRNEAGEYGLVSLISNLDFTLMETEHHWYLEIKAMQSIVCRSRVVDLMIAWILKSERRIMDGLQGFLMSGRVNREKI